MPDATTREHTNPGATFFKLRDLFYVASIFRMTGMRASPTECATDVSMNSGILHVYGAGSSTRLHACRGVGRTLTLERF